MKAQNMYLSRPRFSYQKLSQSVCLAASLLSVHFLSACNVPSSLQAQIGTSTQTIRASLVTSTAGQSLRVIQLEQLPEALKNSNQLYAVLDNSNSIYPVTRNADGSLSIPLSSGRRPDSQGIIEILLSNQQQSWLLRFDTGPLLKLESQAIQVNPSSDVTLGNRLSLTLKPQEPQDLENLIFTWSAATTQNGAFLPLSGTGSSITWEPSAAGSYFIRIEMRDSKTGAYSVYTSPSALVSVRNADQIALRTPNDGRIIAGDKIQLKANIPEYNSEAINWNWSYSSSLQSGFTPIAAQGAQVSWEPPAAGSYYLRLQAEINGQAQSYTSSQALVLVSNADDVIQTLPGSGEVIRGQAIELSAKVAETTSNNRYVWSFASSAQGPFTGISNEGQAIQWRPEQTGEFFLRLRVIDTQTQKEKTFTSSKVLVSVKDSDERFVLSPNPAALVKGQSVNLNIKDIPALRNINWFYAPSAQGPFNAISGQGQNTSWTPPFAGTFFVRAEVTGNNQAKETYTSASALVSVTESNNVITASPEGNQALGRAIALRAQVPDAPANATYNWSVGFSPIGPWQAANSFDSNQNGPNLNWYPASSGNYYVKVDMTRPDGQTVSFVSPRALVFANNSRDFFNTSPTPAVIGSQGAVSLSANMQLPDNASYTYVWSSAFSPVGPYTALGGSVAPRFSWQQPGIVGNYYIKLDVISAQQKRVSFISSDPIVFVGESSTSTSGF